jgi:hypothetical protein
MRDMSEQDPPPVHMTELGYPPAGPHLVPPAPVASEPVVAPPPEAPSQRPGPIAFALLAIGFGLALAAQYLPWSSIKTGASDPADDSIVNPTRPLPATTNIDLANMNTGHVVMYLTTIVLALVAITVVVTSGGVVRRTATAAAAGLLAGNVLVLVGFKAAIDNLGASPYTAYSLSDEAVAVGSGYPLAIAATLMLAAGVIAAVRGPLLSGRVSRRRAAEQPDSGEPLDLTVTPVPPSSMR